MTADANEQTPLAVRLAAWLLALATVPLLILGGLTTSYRAGMADPVWPTEPWYIVVNGAMWKEPDRGFILEHTHRFAAWTVGFLTLGLVAAAWWCGPNKKSRLLAFASLVLLVASFGWFHGQMMGVQKAAAASLDGSIPWPNASLSTMLFFLGSTAILLVRHLRSDQPLRFIRTGASLLLLTVMVQGLLGGLRVLLDKQLGLKATLGVELSQLHGVLAQVVFASMLALAAMTAKRCVGDHLSPFERVRLGRISLALVFATFLQLVWAVWVRHAPTPLAQRLHFLTAFAVAALIAWLAVRLYSNTDGSRLLGRTMGFLIAVVVLQVTLGVEAWMGKFAATGPEATVPPMYRSLTTSSVAIRTGHQVLGAILLGTATLLLVRIRRGPLPMGHVAENRRISSEDGVREASLSL